MHRHTAQKQTRTLKNLHPFALSDIRNVTRSPLRPMTASGILFVGLAATAGFTSLALALQPQPEAPSSTSSPSSAHNNTSSSTAITRSDGTVKVTTTESTSDDSSAGAVSISGSEISGQMTVNDEVIPLTPGTTERSYTDSNGNHHSVTVTIDNQSTTVDSDSSSSSIHISSSSTSSVQDNTTRGSPRR